MPFFQSLIQDGAESSNIACCPSPVSTEAHVMGRRFSRCPAVGTQLGMERLRYGDLACWWRIEEPLAYCPRLIWLTSPDPTTSTWFWNKDKMPMFLVHIFFKIKICPGPLSTLPIPVLSLMKTFSHFSRIDIGWSLHSAWEHTEEIWIGECKKAFPSIGLCLYSTGQRINQPQVQTLNKTVQEALVSRAITVSTHFCLVPDLLVACAGQGVSWWQCCCSRRRTTPSPGGSDQYPGSVCTQGSSKTASHCPGLQPNYTTCPVKKKWTVFTRL